MNKKTTTAAKSAELSASPAVVCPPCTKRPSRLRKFFKKTRWWVLLALILGGVWYWRQTTANQQTPVSYIFAKAEKGMMISTVSGTGEVSDSNLLELKPDVSAKITSVQVKAGDTVTEGQLLATLDSKDLTSKVREAENSLASAKASLALKLAGLSAEELLVAQKSVETSKLSYDNAQKDLERAKVTAQEDLTKAELSLTKANQSYENSLANKDLNKDSSTQEQTTALNNIKNQLSSSLLTLRAAIVAVDGVIGTEQYTEGNQDYLYALGARKSQSVYDAKNHFEAANSKYKALVSAYEKANTSDSQQLETLLNQASEALAEAKKMSASTYEALSNSVTSVDLSDSELNSMKQSIASQESSVVNAMNSIVSAKQSLVSTQLNSQSGDLSSSNSVVNARLALDEATNNLEQTKSNNKKNIEAAENDVVNKRLSYESAQAQYQQKVAPPRDVDLASIRLQISQASTAYQEALEDYQSAQITAPIAGKIAKVYQKRGDEASASQTLLAITTDKNIAEVTLNEVDIAKVKVGQKANLTFSAVEDLTITGEVAEVDSLGTATQGVVTYEVKIAFDTQDERIRPQMTVSAEIVVEEKSDTLLVDSAAIKTDDATGLSYVETVEDTSTLGDEAYSQGVVVSSALKKAYVTVGASNDTQTEITEGLSENGPYIKETISSTKSTTASATTKSSTKSGMQMLNSGGGMPGAGGPPQ